jgi:prolyl-tRNA editing enzyme YbaK/EbsC (Cys-tRNA(Pro) deacylase)
LFIPAGGNRVDPSKAAVAAGERLGRADVTFVGTQTGFAIGGVAPVGHLSAPKAFFDSTLLKFDVVYAAAGTRY